VVDLQVLELSKGRDLAWREIGSPGGAPVVAFHGSPGTGHDFELVAAAAVRSNVRLIAVDRPGYGHSTFDPQRSYGTFAADVAELVDHLGLVRFGVVGWSSGGPNAATCARFLGDRLTGCAIVSGPAPPEANIPRASQSRALGLWQRLGVLAPRLFGALFGAGLRQGQRNPEKSFAWMMRMLPSCDTAVIDRPEVRSTLLAGLARPVSVTAGRAAVQDLVSESRPWGFELDEIDVPVHIWHGDADRNVPVANGAYQADHIRGAAFHLQPGEGHWLLIDHFREVLEPLS
jgi:pimeloyl-ACP methyl ester carboxylesterase